MRTEVTTLNMILVTFLPTGDTASYDTVLDINNRFCKEAYAS